MYICSKCGNESIKWSGQCSFCKSWGTLKEFKQEINKEGKKINKGEVKELKKIGNITKDKNLERIKTDSEELNNVLGGGIVPGSIILLTGEPGIGKSTITIQLSNWIKDKKIIYISGEETEYQISSRASRLGFKGENMLLLSESNIENIIETLSRNRCDILVIDSISVISSNNITGVAGSISQVKYISEILTAYAKKSNTSVFVIGHITKDGNIAGPKTLEHMVDTVLYLEGEKYDNLRILRGIKNRFGNTSEVGLFKMEELGLIDIKNPGLEFINNKQASTGSSLSITMEGTRALIIETEGLTTYTKFGYPKRSSRGINNSKLDLIIAVLGKYTKIALESYDVYTNISRGLRIEEPGIDLAIASSIISSKMNKELPKDLIFIGEISLTGNIKKTIHLEKRIKEAEKMGFKKVFAPENNIKSKKIEIIQIKNIYELAININKL